MVKKSKSLKNSQETEIKPEMGFSVACPIMSIGRMASTPCIKQQCEFWIELTYGKQKVGRCAISYLPILLVETRQAIDKFHGKEKNT